VVRVDCINNYQAARGKLHGRRKDRVEVYAKPKIVPLHIEENIYCLHDERGNTIGTGTREVCEVLLYLITKPAMPLVYGGRTVAIPSSNPNVRAALKI
jgi:hypothetical protein